MSFSVASNSQKVVLDVKIYLRNTNTTFTLHAKSRNRMKICIFNITHTSKGDVWKSYFYFVLFFTVHSWFCWFKQCGEMSQCPHVVAEWAVKLRGWALWLAGSSLPYINNNSYNKIKTVTKCYICTNQDSLSTWQKATQVMYQLIDCF